MFVGPHVGVYWMIFLNFILEIFATLSREKQIFIQNLIIIIDTLHENLRNFMTYP
jgi:hypothetical protein